MSIPFERLNFNYDEHTYYVYATKRAVTTIKAYGFKVADNGTLVFTGIGGKIIRVFAHSAWDEIIMDDGGSNGQVKK